MVLARGRRWWAAESKQGFEEVCFPSAGQARAIGFSFPFWELCSEIKDSQIRLVFQILHGVVLALRSEICCEASATTTTSFSNQTL